MSVFSNDDDFSKDFLNYLNESYNEHIQHKKLQYYNSSNESELYDVSHNVYLQN